jgi:pimeloyl-ACP methyl ester carboxylesterase
MGCRIGRTLWAVVVAGAVLLGGADASVPPAAGGDPPPVPGELVDVGGHRLHLFCQGTGGPTVVLDAGSGDFSLDWLLVLPRVTATTRVCAYDRAGLGWSEQGPAPRDAERAVAELRALLRNAGIAPPFVLVGHSSGGLRMQLFAAVYPEEAAGLVLVDSTIDLTVAEQLAVLRPETRAAYEALLREPAALGPPPADLDAAAVLPLIPEEGRPLLAVYAALEQRASHQRATADEAAALQASLAQVRRAKAALGQPPFGDLPLAVLVNGVPGAVASLAPPPSTASAVRLAVEHELAAHLASLSGRGTLIRAERSGHYIQLDEPDLVAATIQAIVGAARPAKGG